MPSDPVSDVDRESLLARYRRVRAGSETLAAPLSPEDWMLQSMTEASPVKWNLAHTSWFFETFILTERAGDYEVFHPHFRYLFNSYYNQVGAMHPRSRRGVLSRPDAAEVLEYRAHVDAAMAALIEDAATELLEKIAPFVALGCAHEEQHQELLLTDLKHGLYENPLAPAAYPAPDGNGADAIKLDWAAFESGLCEIGRGGKGFAFDNEGPRHTVYLQPFELANRPITNGEFLEFMEAGGYESSALWLSDGWDLVCREGWRAPLYWRRTDDDWREFTLFGERPVDPAAPLAHVSYYEAAAYAEWTGWRLPTEFEWERAAADVDCTDKEGFLNDAAPEPPRPASPGEGLRQLYGGVWEWTSSPYTPYPGYRAAPGAVGEYNSKFMSSQMVLKGGSCATPAGHIRATYRNFFPPDARWQFSGLRLARDV
ncbi:MAG: ergothioneine biosynthesis protein EgtB [Parvularculaceae bacterium]